MKLNQIILSFCLVVSTVYSQEWETAPEIWSEPILLDSLFNVPYHWLESPTLTKNMDTIYYFINRIHMSYKKDNKWVKPIKLSDNVNGFSAMSGCTVSKNGKRLYMSAWGGYGGWDLYYSNWDDALNGWAPAINMGPSINDSFDDFYLHEVSKDSIYVIQGSRSPNFYTFDKIKAEWTKIDSFWYHPIGGVDMYGLSITENGKKMYFGKRSRVKENTLDLSVAYWDTIKNYWGNVYNLNINSKKIPWKHLSKRGAEYFPYVSPDGKILIFASNRNVPLHPDSSDNSGNLFISYLLVDENGDSVTNVMKERSISTPLFKLNQNYPNPFNPETNISYTINENGFVKLLVYDAIGRKVLMLVNKNQSKGNYEVKLDINKNSLSSGIYYYQLILNNNYMVKKMTLTK